MPTHELVEAFTSSLSVDKRLWEADLTASRVHARMLGETGILTAEERDRLVAGLDRVRERGPLLEPHAEDVHSEIERLLFAEVGPVAGKLHTARSRNDQVVTATRLYLRGELDALAADLRALQACLVERAETTLEVYLPGTTHLQHAQPVSLAHHLLAYFWMLERDHERVLEIRRRVNTLPLGAAALAGTEFPIDREFVARELGFDRICENSLDAVSDRDFVLEFLGAANLIGLHLSRFAEELVLWSTPEFGFVTLSDAVTTGSSIMPQKKNPDAAELLRGRTGRLVGAYTTVSVVLKGLPLAYNRDLQEDKQPLFEGLDSVRQSVRIAGLMIQEATFHADRMRAALKGDFSNATDLAGFLVQRGLAFREAHEVVGKIVRECLADGIGLEDVPASRWKEYHPLLDETVAERLTPDAVVAARVSRGGTAPSSVRQQLSRARECLA